MEAVSRVAGALAIQFLSTAAIAVEPPPYRAIPFTDVIGEGYTLTGKGVNLERWPSMGDGGDGLRFRFANDTVVVGTSHEEVPGTESLWAARWRLGEPASRMPLDFPTGAMGTSAADANRDGAVVGAVIMSSPPSVRAAAWTFSDGDLNGNPAPLLVFGPEDLDHCENTLPDTVLSAVGPRTAPGGSAMVAGIGGLVDEGGWPDGFLGELQSGGVTENVERLPGTDAGVWCDSWQPADGIRSSFGQCIAWGGDSAPTHWELFTVLGSAHAMIADKEVGCLDAKLWSFCRWTTDAQFPLILSCRGCQDSENGPIPELCAQVSADGAWLSSATNIRLSSFVPSANGPAVSRPLALGGIIGVRTAPMDPGEMCSSNHCAHAHAAVAISSGGLPLAQVELFDLHSVLPEGMPTGPEQPGGFFASGIARIYAWPNNGAGVGTATAWLAVGAVGDDFERGHADPRRFGCFWLGRLSDTGGTQWCARDANDMSIRPYGLTIEAIHDLNCRGLAVGVASQLELGDFTTKRLVYLTEAADLNGDLVIDGTDLGLLMGCWGSGSAECSPFDLDRDGVVGGTDLGLLIAAWRGNGPGCAAGVSLTCDGSAWQSPLQRYPYVSRAAELLGFETMDALGDALELLPPGARIGLCATIDVLATALEEGD